MFATHTVELRRLSRHMLLLQLHPQGWMIHDVAEGRSIGSKDLSRPLPDQSMGSPFSLRNVLDDFDGILRVGCL